MFRVVVSGIVDEPAPLESTTSPKALDKDNLAKFRYTSTDGQSDSLRDSVTVPIGPPPPIGLTKGVQAVNSTIVDGGTTPGNVDGTTVRAGDAVTFRLDLQNLAQPDDVNGDAITSPDVWDVLPAGITCAAITAISNAGTCYDAGATGRPGLSSGDTTSSVIRWQLGSSFSLAPQAYGKLTYTMAIPADVQREHDLRQHRSGGLLRRGHEHRRRRHPAGRDPQPRRQRQRRRERDRRGRPRGQ